ncbi:WD40 repeat-like protein, partial [Linnemannia elongata AG-77]
AMAFSPDCTMVVFGGIGLLGLWNCVSGQEIFVMEGHWDYVHSVTFSPCGKHIASSSGDKTVRVWDSQTGERLFALDGHTDEVRCVKYSPSGEWLVSSSWDGTIRFWNSTTGEPEVVLSCSLGKFYSLAFSLDGRWFASGHEDGELQLWHAESGERGPVLNGHTSRVTGIAFSPDSRWIASSSWDGTARLWDASTGTPINMLSSHKNWVNDVVFSPNGLQIASGGDDKKVRLWDVNSILTSSVELQDQTGGVWLTGYSPNGQHILTVGNQTIKQWNSLTGASRPLPIELPEPQTVESVSYSLNGFSTVVATQDESIRLWESQAMIIKTILKDSSAVKYVTMSPCSRWVVSYDRDGTVTLWDCASTQQMHVLMESDGLPGDALGPLALSAAGHRLAVGYRSGTIKLFDPQSKGLITSKSTDWSIEAMSFSPDGCQLAIGTDDCLVYLCGIQSDEHPIELRGHTEKVTCIAYSPCGDWIASGSKDKTVRLW